MWGDIQSRRNISSLHLTHKELHNSKWRQPVPVYRQISPTASCNSYEFTAYAHKKRFISTPYYFHAIQILTGIESVTIYRTDGNTSFLAVLAFKLSLVPNREFPPIPTFCLCRGLSSEDVHQYQRNNEYSTKSHFIYFTRIDLYVSCRNSFYVYCN